MMGITDGWFYCTRKGCHWRGKPYELKNHRCPLCGSKVK